MVIWSQPAKADLRAIHDYIAADSSYYAKKLTQDIVTKTDVLVELPRIGKMVPELGDEAIRELTEPPYRIIYEIKGEDVFVLAVIHRRRELLPEMVER
ncbi:MAG: type II toxin-antitoxin system RelE/ParE family toxin [Gammaproteobacteria bacterium]|nr:type II toxin-antitoxin system RelE/ParE family toxin [Gammaproteobacteria bacterium]